MKEMYGVVLLYTEGMAICEDDWENLWCAEMPEEFVKQLGADAKQRVIDLAENWEADAKDVAEFLIFSSRFPDYSVRNQMLIYKQNPYAMFTAGYNQFEKMGYTVQKGEKGMRIWVPHNITYYRGKESEPWKRLTKSTPKAVRDMIKAGMLETREELQFYRYGVVFDIAQTNCPAEDYPKLVGLGCADELHAAAFDIISEYSNRCGMPVRTIDLKSVALRGYYESETCNITINSRLADTQRLSTLLHEMAHGMLQHGMDTGKSRAQREFEADALSVMLESAMGLPITDTRKEHMSVEYKNYITELKTGKTDEEKAEINEQIDKVFKPIGDLYKRHAPQILAALRLSGIQPQPIKTAQAAPEQEEKTPEHIMDKPKRKMNRSL